MRILTINVGSSTIKTALFEDSQEIRRFTIEGHDVSTISNWVDDSIEIISHRVVHGGEVFSGPVVIDPEVLEQLRMLSPLAPLHMPMALEVIDECRRIFPDTKQVACFDTAFHHTLPRNTWDLSIPHDLADKYQIRRYGFHGLNCEHVVGSLQAAQTQKLIVAHLGAGCSLTAVANGKSVDTTMSFTPGGGVPMTTRSGDLDPGIVLYLLKSGVSTDELADALEHHSGIAGWSDGISDMKTLLETQSSDAQFAIDAFCDRIAVAAGGLTTRLGGLETLVFTGGIGEHAPAVRERIISKLSFLQPFDVVVVSANEERILAQHAMDLS